MTSALERTRDRGREHQAAGGGRGPGPIAAAAPGTGVWNWIPRQRQSAETRESPTRNGARASTIRWAIDVRRRAGAISDYLSPRLAPDQRPHAPRHVLGSRSLARPVRGGVPRGAAVPVGSRSRAGACAVRTHNRIKSPTCDREAREKGGSG